MERCEVCGYLSGGDGWPHEDLRAVLCNTCWTDARRAGAIDRPIGRTARTGQYETWRKEQLLRLAQNGGNPAALHDSASCPTCQRALRALAADEEARRALPAQYTKEQ